MKKTKWFVFLTITIVAALYVFVETPNLSPLYLDGALFWAVLITAYVGSATLLKIGEFTIQLNNFSYSAKAKFPKVPAIIIALLMICFNLFGNGLRDAFNPSLKGTD